MATAYKYLIIPFDGDDAQGTNDEDLVRHIMDNDSGEAMVVKLSTAIASTYFDGVQFVDVIEASRDDYDFPDDEEAEDD